MLFEKGKLWPAMVGFSALAVLNGIYDSVPHGPKRRRRGWEKKKHKRKMAQASRLRNLRGW